MPDTLALAAQNAGIGETTLHRWLHEEGFQAAYHEAQRQALAQTIAGLQQASGTALTVLRSLMLDQTATSSARASAARSVLEFAFRGAEIADLQERLEAIEAQLAGLPADGKERP